jgi:hypothetical protein
MGQLSLKGRANVKDLNSSGSKPEEKFKFVDKIIIGPKVCRLSVVLYTATILAGTETTD